MELTRTIRRTFAISFVIICAITAATAGLRGPGKYSGVVVFDRWDTSFLLSGPYLTYISDKAKAPLRQYQGTAMQVDASDVVQPMNPGDALIKKFEIVGLAPKTREDVNLAGLELHAEADFGSEGTPRFVIRIANTNDTPEKIFASEIGPTLLSTRTGNPFDPSDGKSTAVLTRISLDHQPPDEPARSSIENGKMLLISYALAPKSLSPAPFPLGPGQFLEVRITFKAYPGQFQFLFGYGGGVHEEQSLASNAISFAIDENGRATLAY